jgi:hypothetical protein
MKVEIKNKSEKEKPLECADKLSKQIITIEWAKMPQVKQEDKMKKKEYVALQPQLGIKPKDIIVIIDDGATIAYINRVNSILYLNPNYIDAFISEGIIAEKKSKAEEITEKILYELDLDTSLAETYRIILKELEKAGIE